MRPFEYDTVEGITQQVQTLEGLHRWIDERHAAYYDRKEQLHSFIILNRWVTDTCGNVARILEMEPRVRLSPVVDMDELRETVHLRMSWGGGQGPLLPELTSKCEVCKIGFTLDNVHEHYSTRVNAKTAEERDTYKFYHTSCWRLFQLKDEYEHFAEIFKNAGFEYAVLTQTGNQYEPGEMHSAPWFNVDTNVGRFLIGWRRRVIHIDWKEIGRDLLPLFDDVTDTKEPLYIHAYRPEKASEYLKRIREALDPLTAKEFEIWSEYQKDEDRGRRPGWGMLHGKAQGVSFVDACMQFFKQKPGEERNLDYWKHDNKFNGAQLFPTEKEARGQ